MMKTNNFIFIVSASCCTPLGHCVIVEHDKSVSTWQAGHSSITSSALVHMNSVEDAQPLPVRSGSNGTPQPFGSDTTPPPTPPPAASKPKIMKVSPHVEWSEDQKKFLDHVVKNPNNSFNLASGRINYICLLGQGAYNFAAGGLLTDNNQEVVVKWSKKANVSEIDKQVSKLQCLQKLFLTGGEDADLTNNVERMLWVEKSEISSLQQPTVSVPVRVTKYLGSDVWHTWYPFLMTLAKEMKYMWFFLLWFLREILQIFRILESKRVVHRDVKLDNITVHIDENLNLNVFLIDWDTLHIPLHSVKEVVPKISKEEWLDTYANFGGPTGINENPMPGDDMYVLGLRVISRLRDDIVEKYSSHDYNDGIYRIVWKISNEMVLKKDQGAQDYLDMLHQAVDGEGTFGDRVQKKLGISDHGRREFLQDLRDFTSLKPPPLPAYEH